MSDSKGADWFGSKQAERRTWKHERSQLEEDDDDFRFLAANRMEGQANGFRRGREFDCDTNSDIQALSALSDKQKGCSGRGRCLLRTILIIVILNALVYFCPTGEPEFEAKIPSEKPRPTFEGPLAMNSDLDSAETLFEGQFHAPESMAWTNDARAFYTGVEGGFIILVEPYEERWSVVARLNARDSVRDLTKSVKFEGQNESTSEELEQATNWVPFCESDVEVYGRRAEFESQLVYLSRCSRPLGIRLSPNESYLYVSDSLSGLYRVDLAARDDGRAKSVVSKLIHFDANQRNTSLESSKRILFGDDIAVAWSRGRDGGDLIYLTDCSQKWSLRYLLMVIAENDDSGRVLTFDTSSGLIRPLESVSPARLGESKSWDWRNLSFPNGLELSATGSSLLISDLNNRRILLHHLEGPLSGQTDHLLWVPGYPDNIRRGLSSSDGEPTYWVACACATSDWSAFEFAEFFDQLPRFKRLALNWLHLSGWLVELLGKLLGSSRVLDVGVSLKSGWLKADPYCSHGLVFQFDESGRILRSLHAPRFGSRFKIVSEAHQVPVKSDETGRSSFVFLGSVFYSFLGRLRLDQSA